MRVVVYTSVGCARCQVLKSMLDSKGIPYEVCEDVEEMQKLGIQSIPVLSVDGHLMSFPEAFNYVNER